MNRANLDLPLLLDLLQIDSPSGDEGTMADWLESYVSRELPDVRLIRVGDSLIAVRGNRPGVAIFAHIDTTGFTLGYGSALIPIGGPSPRGGDVVRRIGQTAAFSPITVRRTGELVVRGKGVPEPGSRLVYAASPAVDKSTICSPYLDNRAGVCAALSCLVNCTRIAVVFTAGEEHSGNGALVCAGIVYRELEISKALIADVTWDTAHVTCGRGVAISLRDRMVPRRRFLDRVLRIAAKSGIPHQLEIESSGGSDGGFLQRSGYPIDWVFIGAPEVAPHTARERVDLSDLEAMNSMLAAVALELQLETQG